MKPMIPIAVVIALGTPAIAQHDRAESCEITAGIVADAVTERAGGATSQETVEAITSGNVEDGYSAAVAPLVDWVYTLDEDKLTDEAADAYREACIAQLE